MIEELSLDEANIAFRREVAARAERGDPPLIHSHVALGDQYLERARNLGKCSIERRLVERLFIAEKA